MLPHDNYGPMDALPQLGAEGKRAGFLSDGKWHYGRITHINKHHVTLQLEKRWNHRTVVTLHWNVLRLPAVQESPPPPQIKSPIDPIRVEYLRTVVNDTHRMSHHDDADKERVLATCNAMHDILTEYVQNFDAMRSRIYEVAQQYEESRHHCISIGIDPPPALEPLRDVLVPLLPKRNRNTEEKRQLASLRDTARHLLHALLIAAGDEGVTSEEVAAILCNGDVTQHRIMGMLSAFSRRKQARLLDNGKWILERTTSCPPQ